MLLSVHSFGGPMTRLVAVTGTPAVGKTTLCRALEQQGFEILEILEKGDWCAIAAK